MNAVLYPSLPVVMVDDEARALDGFETWLLFASVNNIIRCEDSRDVMPLLCLIFQARNCSL
jgi:hypothetical protein